MCVGASAEPGSSIELTAILDRHLSAIDVARCGSGVDPYMPEEPLEHPMAYALYIRGLTELYASTGRADYLDAARSAGKTLLTLRSGESVYSWGLPFESLGQPANHPYVVTTALCGLAFAALWRQSGLGAFRTATIGARDWIRNAVVWHQNGDRAAPEFAPNVPLVITNAVAVTAEFLDTMGRLGLNDSEASALAQGALRYVRAAQRPDGLWSYATEKSDLLDPTAPDLVDAVHSGYVLAALARSIAGDDRSSPNMSRLREGFDAAEAALLRSNDGIRLMVEKAVIVDDREHQAGGSMDRPLMNVIPLADHLWLVQFPKETRLWGYGSMFRAWATAITVGIDRLSQATAILQRVRDRHVIASTGHFAYTPDDPRSFPRHEAHLFDGLATLAAASSLP